jgi:hypothetical protein
MRSLGLMTEDYHQNIRALLRGPARLLEISGRGIPP